MSRILVTSGDIFASHREHGVTAIVVPVNTCGTMGAGLAKKFRSRYPFASQVYLDQCARGDTEIGTVLHAYGTPDLRRDGFTRAFFFPAKDHWRDPSKLEYIQASLDDLVADLGPGGLFSEQVRRISVPALGCGCGGLAWSDVRPLILDAAARMMNLEKVVVYEPHEELQRS